MAVKCHEKVFVYLVSTNARNPDLIAPPLDTKYHRALCSLRVTLNIALNTQSKREQSQTQMEL